MSRLYDVAVLGGDDAGSWLCAAAFAQRDLRAALILDKSPDEGTPPFFQSVFDPCRSRPVVGPLGMEPCRGPSFPFEPDFQVIVNGKPIDFVADAFHSGRAEERDFQELAPAFHEKSQELCGMAEVLVDEAREKGFPPWGDGFLSGLFSRRTLKVDRNLSRQSFGEWAEGLPDLFKSIFLGTASACVGTILTEEAPLLQVALLWLTARGLSPAQRGSSADIREDTARVVSRRGTIMEASPEALIYSGRTLHGVRLAKGAIIDTRLLVSPVRLFYRLWNEESKNPSFPERIARKSWFLKIEREILPDSLCRRALFINHENFPGSMMLLTRAPRVPRRDTACLTFLGDDSPESPEEAISRLSSSLSWLDESKISVDDTREPAVLRYPAPFSDLSFAYSPRLPLFNVMPHPADVLPSWGPAGTTLSILSMQERAVKTLHKLKKRKS